MTLLDKIWVGVGLFAQAMFSMRFIIQWLHSEKQKKSVVPDLFWYFSFFGGTLLLAYAIHKMDPVFILGQSTGLFIYARNIYFIATQHRKKTLTDQCHSQSASH